MLILLNSIAGLPGKFDSVQKLPPDLQMFAVAALLGALVGSTLGIRLPVILPMRALALIVAGAKRIGVC